MVASLIPINEIAAQRAALVTATTLTFAEVRSRGGAIGRAIGEAGLSPGDRVAIATRNPEAFYCCFAACYAFGFPVVVLDPAASDGEIDLMLGKAKPCAFFADTEILLRISSRSESRLPRVIWRIDSGDEAEGHRGWLSKLRRRWRPGNRWPSIAEFPEAGDLPNIGNADESTAYIMFTSGTTSKPKAVVVSRRALHHHVGTLSKVFGYDHSARLLCGLPTHHTDGLVHGVAASLLTGMTVVNPGPFTQSMELERVLHSNHITHFIVVPTILAMIKRTYCDRPQLFQFGDFKCLISTAGYLDQQLWQEIHDLFQVRVSNFYGMTETVSGSLYCGPQDDTYRIGTLGKPIDAVVRVVDENGIEVAPGRSGELQISGEHLMNGYLDDPESTSTVMKNGWLSTGDVFETDRDGFFCFAGRRKDIIKRGGITVYPEDIRRVVSGFPGIREVEVVGMPDPTFEQIIVVCAVTDTDLKESDIRAVCRDQLAPERQPDRVELMDSLPRGPSGKVQKKKLIDLLGAGGASKTVTSAPLRDQVIGVAAEIFASEASLLDESSSPVSVANWDSYAGMEFVLALEKEFSFRLRPREIMQLQDLGTAIMIVENRLSVCENGE